MAQSSYYLYSPLDGPDTIRLLVIEAADDKIPGQIKCFCRNGTGEQLFVRDAHPTRGLTARLS